MADKDESKAQDEQAAGKGPEGTAAVEAASAAPASSLSWEDVGDPDGDADTSRARVPGGWLYRSRVPLVKGGSFHLAGGQVVQTFVPDAAVQ